MSQSGNDSAAVTIIGLLHELESRDFRFGKLKLSCVANLFGVFSTTIDLWFHEDKPRLASVLGTRDSAGNFAHNICLNKKCSVYVLFSNEH